MTGIPLGTGWDLIYLLGSTWVQQGQLKVDRLTLSASWTCWSWQGVGLGK